MEHIGMRLGVGLATLALLAACAGTPGGDAEESAAPEPSAEPRGPYAFDVLFTDGAILTMARERSEAAALAVRDGEIVALGGEADVERMREDAARVVDLAGRALLPGFVEPHTHPVLAALLHDWVDISGFTHERPAEIWSTVREAVAAAAPGEWVYAFGFDPVLTPGLEAPDRDRLDALAPENPLFVLMQSMHVAWVNSAALAAAGVDERTPQPGGGARFVRGADGRLTGRLEEEGAMAPFLGAALRAPEAVRREQLAAQYRRYAAAGITTLGATGLFLPDAGTAALLDAPTPQAPPLKLYVYLRPRELGAFGAGALGPRVTVNGVKVWYDGSPYAGTAYLEAPYRNTPLAREALGIPPGSTGRVNLAPELLRERLQPLHDAGWQIAVHAQGDRAVREAIGVLEALLRRSPRVDHRHRIEHAALFPPSEMARAAALGVTASFHVNHLYYHGDALERSLLGPERTERLLPLASAAEHGLRPSVHADSPMYPPRPLLLLRSAVTRVSASGALVGHREAVSLERGLRALTADAAWQLRAEDRVGSLAAGKAADLVVLSADPRSVPPGDLHGVRVVETWIDGRRVFDAERSPSGADDGSGSLP